MEDRVDGASWPARLRLVVDAEVPAMEVDVDALADLGSHEPEALGSVTSTVGLLSRIRGTKAALSRKPPEVLAPALGVEPARLGQA